MGGLEENAIRHLQIVCPETWSMILQKWPAEWEAEKGGTKHGGFESTANDK